jgi:PKD repeat protein
MKSLFTAAAATLACLTLTACTVHQTEAPPLSGPSDLALSIRVDANPDTIGLDGGSQSSVRVTAIGPDGRGLAGVTLRVDTAVDGAVQDFGQLSARSIVTDSNGIARVTFTSPVLPPGANAGTCRGLPGKCVTIVVTPTTSTGFGNVSPSTVDIRLVPPGVILPPPTTPTPCITVSPSSPPANTPAQFTAGSVVNGTCTTATSDIVSFEWAFGDGGTASGRQVTHTFAVAGSFVVTMTETNDRGIAASTTLSVTTGSSALPTASFTRSPSAPAVNDTVFFNATPSTAGAGHTIVSYRWDFGDGTPNGSGVTTSHQFATTGSFTVLLTVQDEAGQIATSSQQVSVGTGAPSASFTSVVVSAASHTIGFDASATTAQGGATITSYSWSFGDFSTNGSGRTTTHSYPATGTFSVTLTVTDSLGRTGSITQSVAVP